MQTSSKHTPKSCSCSQCKRGKHSTHGHFIMKYDERAFRHNQKQRLNKSSGDYMSAPMGGYYD